MKTLIICIGIFCLLSAGIAGAKQSSEKPVFVSLIIDMNVPPSANDDQLSEAKNNLLSLYGAIGVVPTTLVLANDASDRARLILSKTTSDANPDVAISGNHSDELLSTKSYSEQKDILKNSKKYAELCKICGKNEVNVYGFMPQSFDQNEDTYKVLDDMGIKYNAGFQAGILNAPGHENDVWPYKVENHKFYAVPVSTYDFSGELIPLDDRYITGKSISASQWKDLLIEKFDAISDKDEPMVLSLSTSVSGSGEYLKALVAFMDYAASRNASFVTAYDLVQMSGNEVKDLPVASTTETAQERVISTPSPIAIETNTSCPECDEIKNSTAIKQIE
jgi:hypothetical protein